MIIFGIDSVDFVMCIVILALFFIVLKMMTGL